jgi:hypothetical protein
MLRSHGRNNAKEGGGHADVDLSGVSQVGLASSLSTSSLTIDDEASQYSSNIQDPIDLKVLSTQARETLREYLFHSLFPSYMSSSSRARGTRDVHNSLNKSISESAHFSLPLWSSNTLLHLLLADRPPDRANLYRSAGNFLPSHLSSNETSSSRGGAGLMSSSQDVSAGKVGQIPSGQNATNDDEVKDKNDDEKEKDDDDDDDEGEDDDEVGELRDGKGKSSYSSSASSSSLSGGKKKGVSSRSASSSSSSSANSSKRAASSPQGSRTSKATLKVAKTTREDAFSQASGASSSGGGRLSTAKGTETSSSSSFSTIAANSSTPSSSLSAKFVPCPTRRYAKDVDRGANNNNTVLTNLSSPVIWRHETQILILIESAQLVGLDLHQAKALCLSFGYFEGAVAAVCADIKKGLQLDILSRLTTKENFYSSKSIDNNESNTIGPSLLWQRLLSNASEVSAICIHLDSVDLLTKLISCCVSRSDLLRTVMISAVDAIVARSNADIFEQQQQQQQQQNGGGMRSSSSSSSSSPPNSSMSSYSPREYQLVESAFVPLLVSSVTRSDCVENAAKAVLSFADSTPQVGIKDSSFLLLRSLASLT